MATWQDVYNQVDASFLGFLPGGVAPGTNALSNAFGVAWNGIFGPTLGATNTTPAPSPPQAGAVGNSIGSFFGNIVGGAVQPLLPLALVALAFVFLKDKR